MSEKAQPNRPKKRPTSLSEGSKREKSDEVAKVEENEPVAKVSVEGGFSVEAFKWFAVKDGLRDESPEHYASRIVDELCALVDIAVTSTTVQEVNEGRGAKRGITFCVIRRPALTSLLIYAFVGADFEEVELRLACKGTFEFTISEHPKGHEINWNDIMSQALPTAAKAVGEYATNVVNAMAPLSGHPDLMMPLSLLEHVTTMTPQEWGKYLPPYEVQDAPQKRRGRKRASVNTQDS